MNLSLARSGLGRTHWIGGKRVQIPFKASSPLKGMVAFQSQTGIFFLSPASRIWSFGPSTNFSMQTGNTSKESKPSSKPSKTPIREYSLTLVESFKKLGAKYGKIAIVTHLTVSGFCLTSFYLALRWGVDLQSLLQSIGLESWANRIGGEKAGNDLIRSNFGL